MICKFHIICCFSTENSELKMDEGHLRLLIIYVDFTKLRKSSRYAEQNFYNRSIKSNYEKKTFHFNRKARER